MSFSLDEEPSSSLYKLDGEPKTILRIREGNNAYKNFIEAFTTNFKDDEVPVSLKVHPGGPDGDTVTGHHAFLDTKLQGCFSKVDLSTVPLKSEVNRSVRRTPNQEESNKDSKDAFFHGKVKKDDTETVENWILLSRAPRLYNKTNKYVKENSTVDVKKAKLGTSYSKLIGKYDSSFADLVDEELSQAFHTKLKTRLEKDKKDVINKIIHAKKKLANAIKELEKMKEDDEEKEVDIEIRCGEELLNWLGHKYEAQTNLEEDKYANRKLRRKPEEGIINMQNKKMKQEDEENKFDEVKKEDKMIVEELDVENNKEKQKEIQSMEHLISQVSDKPETKSKQVNQLIKEFAKLQMKSFNAEKLIKELEIIVSQIRTEELPSIDSKVLSWVNEYQKGDEKSKLLKDEKQKIQADASVNVARARMNKLTLKKKALIDAFQHLTQNPFEDDELFAKHIINLIVMISESARFTSIMNHILKFYEKVTTEKDTTEMDTTEKATTEKDTTEKDTTEKNTTGQALSREMIAMMYRWTEASNILIRGYIFKGEKTMWKEKYGLDIEKELPFVRTLNGRTELQSFEE
ncbi:hypothetical protein POM88_002117 [Heracleum sosnowskyi]|uniref:Uncharacterized protein n=1 Tax=Heracleum sosnowskyi TaxID=360622 RepID=A0AAD8NAZ7_9APIA|nr:hypothetical protein POM88_002117 [Heracleum sosnowskyi]